MRKIFLISLLVMLFFIGNAFGEVYKGNDIPPDDILLTTLKNYHKYKGGLFGTVFVDKIEKKEEVDNNVYKIRYTTRQKITSPVDANGKFVEYNSFIYVARLKSGAWVCVTEGGSRFPLDPAETNFP